MDIQRGARHPSRQSSQGAQPESPSCRGICLIYLLRGPTNRTGPEAHIHTHSSGPGAHANKAPDRKYLQTNIIYSKSHVSRLCANFGCYVDLRCPVIVPRSLPCITSSRLCNDWSVWEHVHVHGATLSTAMPQPAGFIGCTTGPRA